VDWVSRIIVLFFIVPLFFLFSPLFRPLYLFQGFLLYHDLVEIGEPQRAAEDDLNRASAQHAPVPIEERRDRLINSMNEFDRQRVQNDVDSRGRIENHYDIERV